MFKVVFVNSYTWFVLSDLILDGKFSKVRPGDCLVAFSRNTIFRLKAMVEQHTGYHCAVVYGGLPSGKE